MPDSSVLKEVWKESVETYRTQIRLSVQLITIFLLADISLIGYSIAEQSALLIWLGIIFLLLILIQMFVAKKLMLPVLFTAISAEHELQLNSKHRLVSNYLSYLSPRKTADEMQIIESESISEFLAPDNYRDFELFGNYSWVPKVLIWAVIAIQAFGPIFLIRYFGWSLV